MNLKLAIPLLLHELASIVWIGGMCFSHFFLRPVLKESLEPPARIQLALGVFRRFFPWVWVCIATLWVSGGWVAIIHGHDPVGRHVLAMAATAFVMTLIFVYLNIVPYRQMRIAVEEQNWRGASAKFAGIRSLIALNLVLGLATVAIASAGPAVLLDLAAPSLR